MPPDIYFDQGLDGLRELAGRCRTLVVVDVLSFSTAVDVAVSAGARVLPLPWRDERAAARAREAGAALAGPRAHDRWSLSPSSLRTLPPGELLALPSPNGAALCAAASADHVLVGGLRNASAVARAAVELPVGVVAAGERRGGDDGPLRPAVEDLLGAGAIIAALPGSRSAEAQVAAGAFAASSGRVEELVRDCASGQQLADLGFPQDVRLAAQLDASGTAPVLRDGIIGA